MSTNCGEETSWNTSSWKTEKEMGQMLYASSEAFMAVIFQVEALWVVTPCSVVVGYQIFGGPCYPHVHFGTSETLVPQHYTVSQARRCVHYTLTELAQDRVQWRGLVLAMLSLRILLSHVRYLVSSLYCSYGSCLQV
jgi:hypothetical protein